jgi:hypothetical protein
MGLITFLIDSRFRAVPKEKYVETACESRACCSNARDAGVIADLCLHWYCTAADPRSGAATAA